MAIGIALLVNQRKTSYVQFVFEFVYTFFISYFFNKVKMTSLLSESLTAVSANLLITIDKVQYKRQGVNITSLARHGLLAGRYNTISDWFHIHVTPKLFKKGTLITHHTPKPYYYGQKINFDFDLLCD